MSLSREEPQAEGRACLWERWGGAQLGAPRRLGFRVSSARRPGNPQMFS